MSTLIGVKYLLFCAALTALVSTSCGRAEDRSVDSTATAPVSATEPALVSEETAASPPQLTPTPAPVITSSGWLIHVRGDGVYASALDGSQERHLDAGPIAPALAQYAGVVRGGEDLWIYLLAPMRHAGAPGDIPSFEAAVLRTSVATSVSEEVFHLPEPVNLWMDGDTQYVSLAPDGGNIAYGARDGVHIRSLGASSDERVISTNCAGSERCAQYMNPVWSPRGDTLLMRKQFYEGSNLSLIRLSAGDRVIDFEDVSGERKTWSPDGRRFCASSEIYEPGGAWLYETDTLARSDLSGRLGGVRSSVCLLSNDKAAVHFVGGRETGHPRMAFFAIEPFSDNVPEVFLPEPYQVVLGWLPSGDGVLVSGYASCQPCGERDPETAVLLTDGTLRSLPFEAGRVLAVVP